jgi:HNH endonuclease
MSTAKQRSTRLRKAANHLRALADGIEAGETTRGDLDHVLAEITGVQRDHFGPRPRAARGEGGKAKILAYLKERVGDDVYGEELGAASGIHEWARRVRELRVEDGYEIVELGQSTYRLESSEPNHQRAAQWQLANELRNRRGSARERIGMFFEANVGQVVARDQIDYVARIAEGSRRTRELRDEFGWPIESNVDDPTLQPGEYRLISKAKKDRRDPSQRLYPDDLRQRVFERDNYTCQVCGRNREKAEAAGDRRFYLEVHHKVAVADDLAKLPKSELNKLSNLATLCHSDHIRETKKLQAKKRSRRGR